MRYGTSGMVWHGVEEGGVSKGKAGDAFACGASSRVKRKRDFTEARLALLFFRASQPCFPPLSSISLLFCFSLLPSPSSIARSHIDLTPASRPLSSRRMNMVQPRLAPYVRRALRSSRAFHSSPRSYAPAPLSVAHLLDTPPPDPDNVTVNGFIRSIRNQKQRSFASVGDGSSLEPLQALLTPEQAQKSGHPLPPFVFYH